MSDKPGLYKYVVATTKRHLGELSYGILDIVPDERHKLHFGSRSTDALKELISPTPRHNIVTFSWDDSAIPTEVLRTITETNSDDENFLLALGDNANADVILIITEDMHRFVRDTRPGRTFVPEAQWNNKNYLLFHAPGTDVSEQLKGCVKHRTETFYSDTVEAFSVTAVVCDEEELERYNHSRVRALYLVTSDEERLQLSQSGCVRLIEEHATLRGFNSFFNWGVLGGHLIALGGWVDKTEMIYDENGGETGFIENEVSTFVLRSLLGMARYTCVNEVLSFIRNCCLNISPTNGDLPFDQRWVLHENALNLYGDGAVAFLMNNLRQRGIVVQSEGSDQYYLTGKGWHFFSLIEAALAQ